MKRLRKIDIRGAFAFASAVHVRAAKDGEEIRVGGELIIGKLHRANAFWLSFELVLGIGDNIDAVEEDFGREASGIKARVVLPVIAIVLVRERAELIGPAIANDTNEFLEVVPAGDEVLGEVAEERRVSGRIGDA